MGILLTSKSYDFKASCFIRLSKHKGVTRRNKLLTLTCGAKRNDMKQVWQLTLRFTRFIPSIEVYARPKFHLTNNQLPSSHIQSYQVTRLPNNDCYPKSWYKTFIKPWESWRGDSELFRTQNHHGINCFRFSDRNSGVYLTSISVWVN